MSVFKPQNTISFGEVMGKAAQEIVKGDKNAIISDLKIAYANEWSAHFYFSLAGKLVAGLRSPVLAEHFEEHSNDELGHAKKLADRIIELGGEIPATMGEVERLASVRVTLPKDPRDLSGFLKAFISLERAVIKSYQELADTTHGKDLVTHELAEDLLADEVRDEEEFENLLD